MQKLFFKCVRTILGGIIILGDKIFPPRAVKLGEAQQRKFKENAEYLWLYQFPSCPFCIRVRRHSKRLGIPLKTRNILENESWHTELETLGGKRKVPCLRIEDEPGKVEWLYESKVINQYLSKRFGSLTA